MAPKPRDKKPALAAAITCQVETTYSCNSIASDLRCPSLPCGPTWIPPTQGRRRNGAICAAAKKERRRTDRRSACAGLQRSSPPRRWPPLLAGPGGRFVKGESAPARAASVTCSWSLAWAGGWLSPCRCFHRRRRTDRHHRTRAPTRLFQAAYRASPGPFPFQDLSA